MTAPNSINPAEHAEGVFMYNTAIAVLDATDPEQAHNVTYPAALQQIARYMKDFIAVFPSAAAHNPIILQHGQRILGAMREIIEPALAVDPKLENQEMQQLLTELLEPIVGQMLGLLSELVRDPSRLPRSFSYLATISQSHAEVKGNCTSCAATTVCPSTRTDLEGAEKAGKGKGNGKAT